MKWNWVILTCVSFVIGCGPSWIEFKPVKMIEGTENRLVVAPELETPEFHRRLIRVLAFYAEPYRTNAAGALLVSRKLGEDKELVWNYTTKALDDHFMEQTGAIGARNKE